MKEINECLNQLDIKNKEVPLQYRVPFVDPTLQKETANVVNELFKALTGIFPAFRQAYPTEVEFDNAKKEWVKGFIDHGLRDLNKIQMGIAKLRGLTRPFVPSIGEFISLCKHSPEDHGLPSIDAAYQEAVKRAHPAAEKNWSHAAIRETIARIGFFDFNRMNAKESRCAFEKHYHIILEELLSNKEPPKIEKAAEKKELPQGSILPQYQKARTSQNALAQMYKILGVKQNNQKTKENPC